MVCQNTVAIYGDECDQADLTSPMVTEMSATKVLADPELPAEALNSTWTDSNLARLAQDITDWEAIAPLLSITEAEEREIKEDNPRDYKMQKYALLRKWKVKNQQEATYRQLMRVFNTIKEMELVEKVKEIMLHPEATVAASNVLEHYQEFLQRSYQELPHPSLLPDQWPIMKKPVFVVCQPLFGDT